MIPHHAISRESRIHIANLLRTKLSSLSPILVNNNFPSTQASTNQAFFSSSHCNLKKSPLEKKLAKVKEWNLYQDQDDTWGDDQQLSSNTTQKTSESDDAAQEKQDDSTVTQQTDTTVPRTNAPWSASFPVQSKVFHLERTSNWCNRWDPHPLTRPFSRSDSFETPEFFSQDDEFVYTLQEQHWNFDPEAQNMSPSQERIYILWLFWNSSFTLAVQRLEQYIHNVKEKRELSSQELTDLLFLCAAENAKEDEPANLESGMQLYDQFVRSNVVPSEKPKELTVPTRDAFLILFMYYRTKYPDQENSWRRRMKNNDVQWDSEFQSIEMAQQIILRGGSSESFEDYMCSFHWPLNTRPHLQQTFYKPCESTYALFILTCSRESDTRAAEAVYQTSLQDPEFCSSEVIVQSILRFYASTKQADKLLAIIKERFYIEGGTNTPSDENTDSKFPLTRKLFLSLCFNLIRGQKKILWRPTFEFLDMWKKAHFSFEQKQFENPPPVDYNPSFEFNAHRAFIQKMLRRNTKLSSTVDPDVAAESFIDWCSPHIERKVVVLKEEDVKERESQKKPDRKPSKQEMDEGWATYDVRAFEDDYDQYSQVYHRVTTVESEKNPLNYFTPKSEIHEYISFKKRFLKPTSRNYCEMMTIAGLNGLVEEAKHIEHIAKADRSIKHDADTSNHLTSYLITAFVKSGDTYNLDKAARLFKREFKSHLPVLRGEEVHSYKKGTKAAPEFLLILFRNAYYEAQDKVMWKAFDAELERKKKTAATKYRHSYSF